MTDFGNTHIGTGSGSPNVLNTTPFALAQLALAPQSGNIAKLSHYLVGNGNTMNFIPCIWANNSGVPGALIAQGTEVITPGAMSAQWVDMFFGTPPAVVISTYYFIGVMIGGNSSGAKDYYDDTGSNTRFYQYTGITYPTPPNPFVYNGYSNGPESIYATYAVSGVAFPFPTLRNPRRHMLYRR